jgi:hypothetical protein
MLYALVLSFPLNKTPKYTTMTWLFEGKPFKSCEGYYGFIYEITCKKTGKSYIGRKYFTKAKTLQPLKGRVNKRRSRVDSDWQNYWGSSTILQEDIIKKGESNFERKILRLCKTRGEVNYWEVKVMFEKDVLSAKLPNGDNKYYNENIMMKFTRSNIGG